MGKVTNAEYADRFAVITSICDERRILRHWIRREVTGKFPIDRPLRFLSVGAGPGDFDFALIEDVLGRGVERVHYTAVEPSPIFGEALSKRAANDSRIELKVLAGTFESVDLEGPYDFILFMHSLYYMKDRAATIERARSALTISTGRLVLIHQSSQGVSIIQNRFVRDLGLNANPGMAAELLLDIFDELRFRLATTVEYSVVATTIETTQVLNELSPVGPILFQFLLNADASSFPANVMHQFRSFVGDMSYKRAHKFWMLQPLGIFVVGTAG